MNIDTLIMKKGRYDVVSRCFALYANREKFSPKEAAMLWYAGLVKKFLCERNPF